MIGDREIPFVFSNESIFLAFQTWCKIHRKCGRRVARKYETAQDDVNFDCDFRADGA